MSWRSVITISVVSVILAGCQTRGFVPGGETVSWMKKGTTRNQRLEDGLKCQVTAAQAVPTSTQVKYSGGYSNPGTLQCYTSNQGTTCNQVGGYTIPASMNSYDANTKLRNEYFQMCMRKMGYTLEKTKFCNSRNDRTSENCVVPVF